MKLQFFLLSLFLFIGSHLFACDLETLVDSVNVEAAFELENALISLRNEGLNFSSLRLVDQKSLNNALIGKVQDSQSPVILKIKKMRHREGNPFSREIEVMKYLEQHWPKEEGLLVSSLHPVMGTVGKEERYVLMKMIDGISWESHQRAIESRGSSSQRSFVRALTIYLKALKVVSIIHDLGVVHLDLKRENIILGTDGKVYIIDFGSSYIIGDHRYSVPGQTITIPYAAPEMKTYREAAIRYSRDSKGLRPSPEDVGPWSDFYSLGKILQELIRAFEFQARGVSETFYFQGVQRTFKTYIEKLLAPLEERKKLNLKEVHSSLTNDQRVQAYLLD